MKFKTLSNREVRMDILPERYPMRSRDQSKSHGQYMLGRLVRSLYGPSTLILEEFALPEERLWLDFYLPHNSLAFEYQGEQHDKFNKFFHGDKTGFEKSKARDKRKEAWCELNQIILVPVRGFPSVEDLQRMIEEARHE
jgi:hypothetical protein